jgi:hypothetical protein
MTASRTLPDASRRAPETRRKSGTGRAVAWGIGGGAVLLALAAIVASSTSDTEAPPIEVPIVNGVKAQAMIEDLVKAGGLDQQWLAFWIALAASETHNSFQSNVVLGDPGLYPRAGKPSPSAAKYGETEAAAAKQAYARAAELGRFDACEWPESAYVWGSGGWWSMIPANAWTAYVGTPLVCRHPHYLLHPVDQLVTGVPMAKRIMDRPAFRARPTWLSLRVGWGSPARIGDDERRANTREDWSPEVRALGLPDAWMDTHVTPLPRWDVTEKWNEFMRRFFS